MEAAQTPVSQKAGNTTGRISYWGVALRPKYGMPHGNAARHAVPLRRALDGRLTFR